MRFTIFIGSGLVGFERNIVFRSVWDFPGMNFWRQSRCAKCDIYKCSVDSMRRINFIRQYVFSNMWFNQYRVSRTVF